MAGGSDVAVQRRADIRSRLLPRKTLKNGGYDGIWPAVHHSNPVRYSAASSISAR